MDRLPLRPTCMLCKHIKHDNDMGCVYCKEGFSLDYSESALIVIINQTCPKHEFNDELVKQLAGYEIDNGTAPPGE